MATTVPAAGAAARMLRDRRRRGLRSPSPSVMRGSFRCVRRSQPSRLIASRPPGADRRCHLPLADHRPLRSMHLDPPDATPGVVPPDRPALGVACHERAGKRHLGASVEERRGSRARPELTIRQISYISTIPFVTMRDRDSRHRAARDAATAQVAVTADQDSVRAAKVAAVLVSRATVVGTGEGPWRGCPSESAQACWHRPFMLVGPQGKVLRHSVARSSRYAKWRCGGLA